MDDTRFLACLTADYERLREVATASDAGSPVPSCPEWTVAELLRHLSRVYRYVTHALREGTDHEPRRPAGSDREEPLALLERSYAGLRAELAAHRHDDPAGGWYTPDRTAGFWFRRMAQETVIHRIDAELAAGLPVADVPEDLAVDGIDELLRRFLAYRAGRRPEQFAETLGGSRPWTIAVRTHGSAWRIRTAPGSLTVEPVQPAAGGEHARTGATAYVSTPAGAGTDADTVADPTAVADRAAVTVTASVTGTDAGDRIDADAEIAGPPAALLRDLWNRGTPASTALVTVSGPAEAHTLLRACLTAATK